ncbi:hypothetical protein B9P84_02030 [Citrobacter braakii]|uniref:Uncharacterized protein n=1 Tax=Citrobacter braakii TaxID=57706 RepID=A0A1R0FX90_CITBR|nr:hypothetical protein CEP69_17525 [Citrobacter braakii]AUV24838.1 hypothetical protein C2U38_03750 [Citrobacter freundii complex sp. CFNIH3]PAX78950.1 hypothetical protein CIK43_15480 [Citrobacter sp. TSA-1]PLC61758.1 hypothetical protein B9P82_19005 [Citrobacter sp. L55]POV72851.1 hypothetical protein C3411_02365 [Citrobacter freundii complex sp. CFNIH5]
MPASPPITTLSHKFPLKGVYGAEENLVKQVTALSGAKNPLFTANISVEQIPYSKRSKLTS